MFIIYRLPLEHPWSVLRLLTPDLGIFIISLVTLVLCNRLLKQKDDAPDKDQVNEVQPVDEVRGLATEIQQ